MPRTPLAKYLEKHRLTPTAFAAHYTAIRGRHVWPQQVTMWARGTRPPGLLIQEQLQIATHGAVTLAQWAKWRREAGL